VTTRPPEEIVMTPIHSKIALPLALLASPPRRPSRRR
jgi:hypothetical protein